jgi:hypothetical protein
LLGVSVANINCSLFTNTFSITFDDKHQMKELWVRNKLEGSGRGQILRYYPSICLEGVNKTMKNLSQDSQSPG